MNDADGRVCQFCGAVEHIELTPGEASETVGVGRPGYVHRRVAAPVQNVIPLAARVTELRLPPERPRFVA